MKIGQRRYQAGVGHTELPCGHLLANSRREIGPVSVTTVCGACGSRDERERCFAITRRTNTRCIHATVDGSRTCRDHLGWIDGAKP
jgi:hypothetical protein